MKISAFDQVSLWQCGLPPKTKHRVRLTIRGFTKNRGEIKGLRGPLEGFNRLSSGELRIIYRQTSGSEIFLDYANTRDAVYELYEQILENRKSPSSLLED